MDSNFKYVFYHNFNFKKHFDKLEDEKIYKIVLKLNDVRLYS